MVPEDSVVGVTVKKGHGYLLDHGKELTFQRLELPAPMLPEPDLKYPGGGGGGIDGGGSSEGGSVYEGLGRSGFDGIDGIDMEGDFEN